MGVNWQALFADQFPSKIGDTLPWHQLDIATASKVQTKWICHWFRSVCRILTPCSICRRRLIPFLGRPTRTGSSWSATIIRKTEFGLFLRNWREEIDVRSSLRRPGWVCTPTGIAVSRGPTAKLNAVFPAHSRLQSAAPRQRSAFLKAYSTVLSVTIPAGIAGVLSAEGAVRIVLGPKWLDATPIFRFLAPTALAFGLIKSLGWLLTTGGQVVRSLNIALPARPRKQREAQLDQRRLKREQPSIQIRRRRLVGIAPAHYHARHLGE